MAEEIRAALLTDPVVAATYVPAEEPPPAAWEDTQRARRVRHLRAAAYVGPSQRPRWLSLIIRALLPVGLFALWWAGTSHGFIKETALASPPQVWDAFKEIVRNGELTSYLGASLARLGQGIALGAVLGLLLGIISGLWSLGEEVFDSTIQMWRAIPFIALSPLFVSWFGIGERFKIVLIAAATFTPMYTYSFLGVRGVDRKLIETAQSFGCKGWTLVRKVVVPLALPSVLMGLRICLATALLGLILAESVGADTGIGYLVNVAQQYDRQDYLVLAIVLYAAIGLIFDFVVRTVERLGMPWRTRGAAR